MSKPKKPSVRGANSPLRGRPSKYKPEYCEMMIAHTKAGGFFEGFAMSIDVTKETLLDWTTTYPDFSDAYKKASQAQLEHFQKLGYGLATGQVKGQVAAWCFMMKNMFKWRDVQEIDMNKTTTQKLIINMGDDE